MFLIPAVGAPCFISANSSDDDDNDERVPVGVLLFFEGGGGVVVMSSSPEVIFPSVLESSSLPVEFEVEFVFRKKSRTRMDGGLNGRKIMSTTSNTGRSFPSGVSSGEFGYNRNFNF